MCHFLRIKCRKVPIRSYTDSLNTCYSSNVCILWIKISCNENFFMLYYNLRVISSSDWSSKWCCTRGSHDFKQMPNHGGSIIKLSAVYSDLVEAQQTNRSPEHSSHWKTLAVIELLWLLLILYYTAERAD